MLKSTYFDAREFPSRDMQVAGSVVTLTQQQTNDHLFLERDNCENTFAKHFLGPIRSGSSSSRGGPVRQQQLLYSGAQMHALHNCDASAVFGSAERGASLGVLLAGWMLQVGTGARGSGALDVGPPGASSSSTFLAREREAISCDFTTSPLLGISIFRASSAGVVEVDYLSKILYDDERRNRCSFEYAHVECFVDPARVASLLTMVRRCVDQDVVAARRSCTSTPTDEDSADESCTTLCEHLCVRVGFVRQPQWGHSVLFVGRRSQWLPVPVVAPSVGEPDKNVGATSSTGTRRQGGEKSGADSSLQQAGTKQNANMNDSFLSVLSMSPPVDDEDDEIGVGKQVSTWGVLEIVPTPELDGAEGMIRTTSPGGSSSWRQPRDAWGWSRVKQEQGGSMRRDPVEKQHAKENKSEKEQKSKDPRALLAALRIRNRVPFLFALRRITNPNILSLPSQQIAAAQDLADLSSLKPQHPYTDEPLATEIRRQVRLLHLKKKLLLGAGRGSATATEGGGSSSSIVGEGGAGAAAAAPDAACGWRSVPLWLRYAELVHQHEAQSQELDLRLDALEQKRRAPMPLRLREMSSAVKDCKKENEELKKENDRLKNTLKRMQKMKTALAYVAPGSCAGPGMRTTLDGTNGKPEGNGDAEENAAQNPSAPTGASSSQVGLYQMLARYRRLEKEYGDTLKHLREMAKSEKSLKSQLSLMRDRERERDQVLESQNREILRLSRILDKKLPEAPPGGKRSQEPQRPLAANDRARNTVAFGPTTVEHVAFLTSSKQLEYSLRLQHIFGKGNRPNPKEGELSSSSLKQLQRRLCLQKSLVHREDQD